MAFYTIDFTVTAGAVTPDTPQFAGHTGDHRAAVVRFSVPFKGYRYRLELTDGSGGYDITDLLDATGGIVSYDVPSTWTAAGVATLRLVAIEQGEDGTETVRFHSAPAYLRFEDRDEGEPTGQTARPAWQETLDEAQFFLETVERKLENGELNGDKGDDGYTPKKGIDYYTEADKAELIEQIEVPVDQELSGTSSNAIANKVVTEKLIEHEMSLSGLSSFDYDLHTRLEEVDERLVRAEQDSSTASSSVSELNRRLTLEVEPEIKKIDAIDSLANNANTTASELGMRLTLEVEPAVKENTEKIGEIETALDGILAIQESLIGGDTE